ncbi:thioesterase family protein [Salinibacterium sp. ZJ70]|uniref:acyl-CoA thioesterase n=1 Tax=Salinibacterium sp. ZJ70 TaxID=2708084 RepID=UPI001422E5CD|nr:thioesterase family protein [Salinibacterium sp. ZJ70]
MSATGPRNPDGNSGTSRALHSRTVRLSYADTDPAGILYYGAWFPQMEYVQTEFLYLQGIHADRLKNERGWWFVSRATECEYLAAAALFDEIRVDMRLGRVGTSSVRFEFEMTRVSDGVRVARAANTIVTVSPAQTTVPIPDDMRARLETWQA